MATYVFVCQRCGEQFEISRPMSERDALQRKPPACPACGKKKVQKVPAMFTAVRDWRTT